MVRDQQSAGEALVTLTDESLQVCDHHASLSSSKSSATDVAISINNVKASKLYDCPFDRLKELLHTEPS